MDGKHAEWWEPPAEEWHSHSQEPQHITILFHFVKFPPQLFSLPPVPWGADPSHRHSDEILGSCLPSFSRTQDNLKRGWSEERSEIKPNFSPTLCWGRGEATTHTNFNRFGPSDPPSNIGFPLTVSWIGTHVNNRYFSPSNKQLKCRHQQNNARGHLMLNCKLNMRHECPHHATCWVVTGNAVVAASEDE